MLGVGEVVTGYCWCAEAAGPQSSTITSEPCIALIRLFGEGGWCVWEVGEEEGRSRRIMSALPWVALGAGGYTASPR